MADVSKASDQLRNLYHAMPPAKRWTAAVVGAVTLAMMIGLIAWSQRPAYQVLFAGLSTEDAGKIVEKLKGSKVPFRLENGGASILVPAENVYETRLQIAGEGLLQGGTVGFEIFDTQKLGMTDFVQKLNYQRAIQGELSRTIQSMASVEKARVHIVIPKKSVFTEQDESPSASVVLKLRPGKGLADGQVAAIAQLVSSSVPSLTADRVSIIDSAGALLSKARGSTDSDASAASVSLQRSIELSLEERARNILEKTVGAGRAVVRVSADVEQKKVESMEEKYDPDSVVIRSEQRAQEKSTGTSGSPQGIPGTPSNVPNAQGVAASTATASSGASTNSSRNNETINYEVSRTTSKISLPVVEIKRMTVAVLVDGAHKVSKDAKGEESSTYVARTTEDLANYEKLVKNAVGFNQARGDAFEIVSAPFLADEGTGATSAQTKMLPVLPASWVMVAKYIASVMLLLILVLLVLRPLIAWITSPTSAPASTSDEYFPMPLTSPEGGKEIGAGTAARGALSQGSQVDLQSLARQEPHRAAQAIKLWLVQE